MTPRLTVSRKKAGILLICLLVGVNACTLGVNQPVLLTPATPTEPSPGWYSVYFTDPYSQLARTYRGGIDENLAAAIDQARLSVDVAVYDLNLWSIRDALLRADRREGLMHHKFVIIDRSEVWTASMNFTTGGGYLDHNNLIRLQSTKLAKDYRYEFEQMFLNDRFGSSKVPGTPDPTFRLNDSLIEVYFSPQDGTLAHLLAAVQSARESIYFLAYSFTSDDLAAALIERAGAGVTVQGVFDQDQYRSNIGTEYDNLVNGGIDVRLDVNPRLMHHKVIIIDQQIVITGSYNFSNNAERNNDENTLIIHNQDIASAYLAEFRQIYNKAQR